MAVEPTEPDHHLDRIELEGLLSRAASFEGLQRCWAVIQRNLDTERFRAAGEVTDVLKFVAGCFTKPPYACDAGVKQIWAKAELRAQLKGLGIPEEFLLHTVRVGALKEVLASVEVSPHQAVRLPVDGTVMRGTSEVIENGRLDNPAEEIKRLITLLRRVQSEPTLDGYSWANNELNSLAEVRAAARASAVTAEHLVIEQSKQSAIARIYTRMHELNFRLQPADAALLRQDFSARLTQWRAFIQTDGRAAADSFRDKHGSEEITPTLFREFRTTCEQQAPDDFQWNIMNPDSGWFAVLIINRATTVSKFISNLHNNMNQWFEL